jgi:hypothetical protein
MCKQHVYANKIDGLFVWEAEDIQIVHAKHLRVDP